MESESAAVHGSLCRVLRVLRVLGVAPLRFTRTYTTVTTVRVWNAQLYYGYVLSTILNAIIVIEIEEISRSLTFMNVTTVGQVMFFMNIICSMLIANLASYGARKRMKYLLLQLNQLNKLTILSPSDPVVAEDRQRTRRASLGILILLSGLILDFGMSVLFLFFVNSTIPEVIKRFMFGAYYVQCAIVKMLAVQIVLVISTIKTAVKCFNCELKRLFDVTARGDHGNEASSFDQNKSLRRLSRYYVALCGNIRQMNSREGLLMLLLIVFHIMQIMDNSYRSIVALPLISSTDQLDAFYQYFKIAMRLHFTVFYVVMLGALTNACDGIQVEVQKMQVQLSKLIYMRREPGEATSPAAAALCDHLFNHQPIFKPLSVCALTSSLFVTVISGVITYLVTVVKFHNMEKSFTKE